MSERGFIAVDRGIFEHSFFKSGELSEREAWIWLIAEACWKPTKKRVGSAEFELQRGQLVHSLRFLANAWKWTDSRVRRFLDRLQSEGMIDAAATHSATQITICNFDVYQSERRTDKAETDAAATQTRTRKQQTTSSEPNGSSDESAGKPRLPDFIRPEVAAGFRDYREKSRHPLTERAIALVSNQLREIEAKGGDPNEALDMCCEHGWRTVKPDWYFRAKTGAPALRVIPGQGPPKRRHGGHAMADLAMDMLRDGPDWRPGEPSDPDEHHGRTINGRAQRR